MGNPQKSWKGAPTANRVVTIPYASNVYTACSGPISAVVTDADGQHRTVNRYTITSTGGVPRARIVATGLTTGVNYTYSLKIKYNGSGTAQSYYIDSSKGNPETNNNSFASRTVTSTPIGNGWYQIVESFVFSACPTGGSWSNFGLSAPNSSYLNQTFDAYDIQFEQQPFATPFVNGTRSNTEAIIDLIGNRTATISPDLTYTSDNKFEFDGINDRILVDTQYPLSWNDPFSLEAVIRIPTGADWHDTTAGSNSGTSIVARGSYSGSHGLLRADTQTFRFWTRTDSGSYASIFSNAQYDTWYHLTGTYNGLINSLYVNGSLVSSVDVVKSGIPDSGSWQIGGGVAFGGNTGKYGKGEIPVAKIYNRALSAAEIQQNFNALRGRYGL
jgi:hypothetical protein